MIWRRTLAAVLTLASVGCAGAAAQVRADSTPIPISFSSALPDRLGRTLHLGSELEAAGDFAADRTAIGFLYGAISLGMDISKEVDTQVAAVRGEGIVNLSVVAQSCWLNYAIPLTIEPVWPGCVKIRVRGVIVRRVTR